MPSEEDEEEEDLRSFEHGPQAQSIEADFNGPPKDQEDTPPEGEAGDTYKLIYL